MIYLSNSFGLSQNVAVVREDRIKSVQYDYYTHPIDKTDDGGGTQPIQSIDLPGGTMTINTIMELIGMISSLKCYDMDMGQHFARN